MDEEQLEQEVEEEMEAQEEDKSDESDEERFVKNLELQEAYGSPEQEDLKNPSSFLHKAAFGEGNTVKTTFLSESELGRPLFNMRFLLDFHSICKHYIDPLCISLELDPLKNNRIAAYFREKINNISDSGMSNRGFAMNLNVTKKMDTTRQRVREIQPIQGGKAR